MGGIVLDVVVLLFLLATIYVCHVLNKRIKSLQDGRSELAEIIAEFDATTKRATDTIAELHRATERIAENIQHRIDKANFVADDLQFLTERANKVMGKMDAGKEKKASADVQSSTSPVGRAKMRDGAPRRARSKAEEELTQMLERKDG